MVTYVELPFLPGYSTTVTQQYNGQDPDHGKDQGKSSLNNVDLHLYYAIDFSANIGTPVAAQGFGKVISFRGNDTSVNNYNDGTDHGFGNYVTVQYYDASGHPTFAATYAHLSSVGSDYVGETVNVGTIIGKTGASGTVLGAHLHVTYGVSTIVFKDPVTGKPDPVVSAANGGQEIFADGAQAANPAGGPVSFVETASGFLNHDGTTLLGDNGHPVTPQIKGFSPDTGVVGDGTTSSKYVYVNGTAEVNSTVLIYDGQTYIGQGQADSSGKFNIVTGSLSEGQHHFTAYDVDKLSFVSSASNSLNVTVDTTAPLPTISAATMKNGTETLSGLVNDSTVKTVAIYDGANLVGNVAVNNSSWSASLNLNATVEHTLTVQAADAAGNIGKAVGSVIFGGTGADTIVSAGNNSFLFGGAGAARDTFVFHAKFGKDTVGDFHPGEDIIQFDRTLFANAATVLSHAANDGHGNTVITYDASDTVTLVGVTTAQLTAHQSDFHIV